MSAAFTVARKEFRALFQSPVALIFLGVFQVFTLFTFFEASRFFARNIADVRPLFEWLPLLLVFLTAAITMRAWAEERKLGTLEVLMTLPVRTVELVVGKFLAAVGLVAVALALTFPLPALVGYLGPLDLGPVVGGYVGALLLGALYVAIGLFISARTDNQVVSLMLTLVVGGALYLVGSDTVTGLATNQQAELLRAIGTGSRFASIERGVIDLRDLVYYGALTAFFLTLNWSALESDRIDTAGARGKSRVTHLWLVGGLVLANAVAAILWLSPVTAVRADLTEGGDYSISGTTSTLLNQLDEPLYIHGYFSERTHPKLAPLVPQIHDMLEEYRIEGRGHVVVNFADPNENQDLETELAEQYSIRSVPFQVHDANQDAVVNSFFHILIKYGDKYEVLSFDDLVEVDANDSGIDVRLKNLEYDLTRTLKKVTQDFSSIGSVLADMPEAATLTAYVTPSTLPDAFKKTLPIVESVSKKLAEQSAGKLTYVNVDPSTDPSKQEELFKKYGLRPLAVDVFAQQTFYFDLVLTMGDQVERISPRGDTTEADLQKAIEAAVKRMVPGQLTTIGFYTEQPEAPPPNPNIPPQYQPPPPRADYQGIEQLLSQTYQVQPIQLDGENGGIPDTIDVLILGKVGTLSDAQRFAIDQFLMRGGRVIALASSHKIDVDRSGLKSSAMPSDLDDLLASYGVTVGPEFVLDTQNAKFPRPVAEQRGGMTFQRIDFADYPFFIDVRSSGFERGHAALSGLSNVTMPWASPLTIQAPDGVKSTVLVRSTPNAWLYSGDQLDAPSPTDTRKSEALAVVLEGTFPSAFKDEKNPIDPTGRVVQTSLPDARLAVLGSSEMVSDILLQLSQSPGGEVHRGNVQFLQNLVDWSTEDTDLLAIRTSGAFARTLDPTDEDTRSKLKLAMYALGISLLIAIAGAVQARRGAVRPFALPTVEKNA